MISIIIPVYKVEQYVTKCILSIIEQDNCGEPIECIIVDDCSPDQSIFMIHSLVDNYQGSIVFRFIIHEQNKGLSAARNTGIDSAHGEYILFVDSDDWLPTDSISKFVKAMRKNPNTEMIIGYRYSTKEKSVLPNRITKEALFDNYQIRKYFLNYQFVTCSAWNKLIKTHIVKKHKFDEGIIFEDILWAYFLFKEIKTSLIIPDVTYIYENDHPYSIINTAKNKDKTTIHLRSISHIGNAILDSPYSDLFTDSIIYYFRYFIIAFRLLYENNFEKEEWLHLNKLRNRLIYTCFKKGRLFLALYIITLTYPPTSHMFNIGWVRRHYHIIEQTGKAIAFFLEKFHRNP